MNALSRAARQEYFSRLQCLRPDAVYSCSAFPISVLAGLGLRPARIPVSSQAKGRIRSREDVCPLMELLAGSMEQLRPRAVIGMHTCDMTRRFYQEFHPAEGAQIHELQLPATFGKEAECFYASQVERLCEDLILNRLSEGYEPERAEKWFRGLRELDELLRGAALSTPPVALKYFHHLGCIMPPQDAIKVIRNILEDHEPFRGEFTLVVSGSPFPPGSDVVAETVEAAGGLLVPAGCGGHAAYLSGEPADFSPGALAVESLAGCRCVRRRPNTICFDHISESAKRFSARGILVTCLSFCDLWFTEKVRFKERFPLPVLVTDSGLNQGESERTAMRVETFIQSLGVK